MMFISGSVITQNNNVAFQENSKCGHQFPGLKHMFIA